MDAPLSRTNPDCAMERAWVAAFCWQDGAPLDELVRCRTCGDHLVQSSTSQEMVFPDKRKPKRLSQALPERAKGSVAHAPSSCRCGQPPGFA
jgi:hypothetical protein